jgi:hypothetical protein
MVNSMSNNTYATTPVSENVIIAYYYCNSKLGATIAGSGTIGTNFVATNENEGLAIAILALGLLREAREHAKNKTEDATPRTIDEIYTAEVEDILLKPDEQAEAHMGYSNDQPTEDWEVTS